MGYQDALRQPQVIAAIEKLKEIAVGAGADPEKLDIREVKPKEMKIDGTKVTTDWISKDWAADTDVEFELDEPTNFYAVAMIGWHNPDLAQVKVVKFTVDDSPKRIYGPEVMEGEDGTFVALDPYVTTTKCIPKVVAQNDVAHAGARDRPFWLVVTECV